jgi:hypothetical protein
MIIDEIFVNDITTETKATKRQVYFKITFPNRMSDKLYKIVET